MAALDELKGLYAELAGAEAYEKKERAGQVREQIAEKRKVVEALAARLDAQVAGYADSGQDGLAGEAAVEARKLRGELDALPDIGVRTDASGKRDTVEAKPTERAAATTTTRKGH
jgi:hypothetical protein